MATKPVADASHRKAKKEASLGMRLTRETKDALDLLAAREGRSVSQVAERLLERAIAGQAEMDVRLGTGGVAQALLAMADFANDVRREIGDPEKQLEARDALMAGWSRMIANALPFTPDTAEGVAARMARVEAKMNARLLLSLLLDALDGMTPEDEVYQWAASAITSTNALNPIKGKSPLQLLLDYQDETGPGDYSTGLALVAALNGAPTTLVNLTPAPSDVASAVDRSVRATMAYMAPRAEAKRKGVALAEGRAGIEPA